MEKERNEWDFTGYKYKSDKVWVQKDWVQTLITKFNDIAANIAKVSYRGGANRIEAHTRFKPLFEMLEYFYENEDGVCRLDGRFKVTFTDHTLKNVISIWHEQEHVPEGYVIVPTEETKGKDPNEMGEISFQFKEATDEEAIEHLAKTRDTLTIKNFSDEECKYLAKFLKEEEERLSKPKPMDIVVGARLNRMFEEGRQFESTSHHGAVDWKPTELDVDNVTLLEEYKKNATTSKGIIFYYTRVQDSFNQSKIGKLNAQSLFIDFNDMDDAIERMDEVSSKFNFHSWAGTHTPTQQVPRHMQEMDEKSWDNFMDEIKSYADTSHLKDEKKELNFFDDVDKSMPEKLKAEWKSIEDAVRDAMENPTHVDPKTGQISIPYKPDFDDEGYIY